ncbi:MAG: InlB B-repeat-containing protein [Lachnospiraceae bacterium]|nr:InlB B-repeat-containing protein [Lachnospiraceae bacterium]
MRRRLSRIIAIMLVLIIAVCNQSYSAWASDEDNNIQEEIEMVSEENEAEQSEIATDSDAKIEMINDIVTEENIEADTENNSDMEVNSVTDDIYDESEAADEGEDEKSYPAFIRSESVDGIRVIVTASEGVFPEGGTLSVNKVADVEEEKINQAVDAVRDDNVMVAQSYTFDIKVLDENGIEIQPADGQTVNVSFAMDEVSNRNLTAGVYHVPEEDGNLVAEELNTTESGDIVTAVSDGFSYYTVEFTYNEKQYVMQGDSAVALTDILSFVGITKADGSAVADSDITSVSVSDESLFSASNKNGEWIVTAHKAFHTDEWMRVTIGGVEYEIVVTDATTYTTSQTNLGWVDGDIFVCNGSTYTFTQSGEDNYVGVSGSSGSLPSNVTASISGKTLTLGGNNYTLSGSNNAWGLKLIESDYFNGHYTHDWNFYETYVVLTVDPTYSVSGTTNTYNGSSKSLVSKSGNGGTIYYRYKKNTDTSYSSWQTSIPTATDAGTYNIQWYSEGDSTYNAKGSSSSPAETVNATINKASISPSVTMNGWTYGNTANNPSVSGNKGNGSVTYRYKVSTANDSTYSETKPSNAGTYTVKAEVASTTNYNGGSATTNFTISQKEISLTWSNKSLIYNGSVQKPTATAGNLKSGDTCTVTVSGEKTNAGSGYTASASSLSNNNYKLPSSKTCNFTISKRTITIASGITASDKPYDGTTSATLNYDAINWERCGRVGNDSLSVTATGTFSDANAGTAKAVTISGLTLGGSSAENYQLASSGNQPSTTANITAKALTVTAGSDAKEYDGTALTKNSYSITSGELATGDSIECVTVTGSQTVVGSSDNMPSAAVIKNNNNQNVTANYSINYAKGTLTVNNRAVTITADSDSKVYDGTALTKNTYTNTSLASGDSIASVTVTGSQTVVGSSYNVPGEAVIKNSSNEDVTSYYTITYANGTLEVTKKPLTITADSAQKVYDTTPLTKDSYTHTALADGETIERVSVTGSQTTVGSSDNVPDDAVIKNASNQDVTTNYNITYVKGVLEVTGKPVTITADSDSKIYDGSSLTKNSYTNTALAEGDYIDSVTISGSQTTVGNSNNVPSGAVIKNSSNEDVTSSYSIAYENGILEVTGKTLTITADSDSKVYDGTELTKDGYTNTALAEGDYIDSVTVTGTQTVAGEGANVPSEAVIKNANGDDVTASYDITYVNGTLEVTKKAVKITADDATKVYDGTPLTKDSYTNSDLVAGDTIAGVIVTGSQANAGQSANVPSEAVIKNANGDDVTASYDITYVDGTLEVTKKPVTIDGITAKDKIYDGTTDAELDYSDIDWSVCGMVDGDELSVTATGTFDNSNVGIDKDVTITDITLGGASVDNYKLADEGQQSLTSADINKKKVTVTALKQTVAVNGEIESSVEYVELSGALEGHKLAEITLISGSTDQTTTAGVITPGKAKIIDGDIDVTENYDITYIDGVMTVTKAEAEVVLDNGDDEAPASVTAVEVPNLLELADEEAEEGKLVKVELSVKPVSENKVSAATVSDVKKTVESIFAFVDMESVKVEYLEIDLTKYIDNMKDSVISDTGKPLEIILTYDTSKAGNPVIIRNHEGTVTIFTQLSSRPTGNFTDATYYVEGDKIYMYSQYFSDFAIAYSVEKTFNVILDDGNGNIIRQIVSEGTKFIPTTELTKDGYDFGGWYKDEAFTEKWNPDTDKVTSDIKLFAKWTKKTEPAKVDVPETKVDTPAEITVPSNTAKSPETRDTIHTDIAFFLMMLATLGIIFLRAVRKKI